MKPLTITLAFITSLPFQSVGAMDTRSLLTLQALDDLGNFYDRVDAAASSLTSNPTHTFQYNIIQKDGTLEVTSRVVVPLRSDGAKDVADLKNDDMHTAANRCANHANRSKDAGCGGTGVGYLSGHNCATRGNRYSCEIRGGETSCLRVREAQGLEGGWCYNA